METTHHTAHGAAQMGGSLSMAVDRLDRALLALEGRLRNLQAGAPATEASVSGAPVSEGGISEAEYQRALSDLEAARNANVALSVVANSAFEALGSAAKNIRTLLAHEVA